MALIVIILTRNEAQHIRECIESVRWADAILVLDSGSTDDTLALAQASGARTLYHEWVNYTVQRNAALEAVTEEWVFFVDADERSSPEQGAEIRAQIEAGAHAGFWVPRHNYILGRLTKGAGWYPDYQLRVLKRTQSHYDRSRAVHETVILEGEAGYLQTPLIHYNYQNLAQFYAKQQRYTHFAAEEMHRQGVRVKPQNYLLQPIRHFIWRFISLKGYRDGLHGLRLSLMMAWYEFQKYRWLAALWAAPSDPRP